MGSNSCVINLDWTDTDTASGSDGLHDNLFHMVQMGGGEWTVIIANADNEGHNNRFVHCNINNCGVGIDVRGSAALNNSFTGGGGQGNKTALVRCPAGGGSIHLEAFSTGNQQDLGVGPPDIIMESGQIMHISSGRIESDRFLRMENGIVMITSIASGNSIDFIEINGGKLIIEGCGIHDSEFISGTGGELYLAGNYFGSTVDPLGDFSGTIKWDPDAVSGSIVP